MIKIVGLCGSPKHGATEYALEQALKAVKEYDPTIETELITLAGKHRALLRLRILQTGKDMVHTQGRYAGAVR
jgi:multimeric flavodoxin WrbA